MSPRAGVGHVHRDLTVLDPAGGAGVLALHTNSFGSLLHIACLIDHQHRIRISERVGDVPT
jgi:hypothetical protein